ATKEGTGDRNAVEEGMRQQSDECPDPDALRDHRLRVCLLAVMEMRCEDMLREVDEQVADQHRDRSAPGLHRRGQHCEKRDCEHEAGAEPDEQAERRPADVPAERDKDAAQNVAERSDDGVEESLDHASASSCSMIASSCSFVFRSGSSITRSSSAFRI